MRKMITILLTAALVLALVACSGSRVRLVQSHVEERHVGKPIRNVLIIAIMEDQKIRAILEQHFKDWLNAKGVEARVSNDLLFLDASTLPSNEAILDVAKTYENDTILIARGVGYALTEVFSRDRPHFFVESYSYYYGGFGYVYWPTVTEEKVQLDIETRLYHIETETLVWAGELQLINPKTTGQAIGQLVEMVIQELGKNSLLPEAR